MVDGAKRGPARGVVSFKSVSRCKAFGEANPDPMRFIGSNGGLGVLVRAGLVIPPSLVNSAIEAMLVVLQFDILEAARETGELGDFKELRVGLVSNA